MSELQRTRPPYETLSDLELHAECFSAAATLLEDLGTLGGNHHEYWTLLRRADQDEKSAEGAALMTTFDQQHGPDAERLDARPPWDETLAVRSPWGGKYFNRRAHCNTVVMRKRKADHAEEILLELGFDEGNQTTQERLSSISFSMHGVPVVRLHRDTTTTELSMPREAAASWLQFCDRFHEAAEARRVWLEQHQHLLEQAQTAKVEAQVREALSVVL